MANFRRLFLVLSLLAGSLVSAQEGATPGEKESVAKGIDVPTSYRPYANPPVVDLKFKLSPGANPAVTLTAAQRLNAARNAADYLCRALEKDGMFLYEFNPRANAYTRSYNWLRHAGSIIAFCDVYAHTKDKQYLDAARLATGALMKQVQVRKINNLPHTVVVSDPAIINSRSKYTSVKTGAAALAAVALMRLDEVSGGTEHTPVAERLCAYIHFTQMSTGELKSKYIFKDDIGYYSAWRSTYYQGEGLLALAMLQARKPTAANLDKLLNLLQFLMRKFEKDNQSDIATPEFDHWGLIGTYKAFPFLKDGDLLKRSGTFKLTRKKILSIVFTYCKNELATQISEPAKPLYGALLNSAGKVSPLATRIEGILAVLRLVKEHKYREAEIPAAAKRVDLAQQYLLRLQYQPHQVADFNMKMDIKGGFRLGLELDGRANDSIRIDNCQHAISALLGW